MYASIHENSVHAAFHHVTGSFRIGNVVMTANSPDYLRRPLTEYKEMLTEMVKQYGDSYIITPRFALSCEPESLKWLGDFSRQHKLWMQTHLSENKQEIISTLDYYRQFPGFEHVRDYLDVYEACGLLHDRAVFAHCIHLQEREKQALKKHGAVIAHCPTSNAPCAELGLGSGLMNYEEIEAVGIPWALGSDIGAGPWLSMLDVMKSFLSQNRRAGRRPGAVKALFRATVMGNRVLGFKHLDGFSVGSEASFVGLPSSSQSKPEYIIEEQLEHGREEFNTLPVTVIHKGLQQF
jgi:guanine deaminase